MFCLGTRLDIFSFPSKLPKITPPGCFHRVAFLRLHWQNNWQFFGPLPCLFDRLSPFHVYWNLQKKNPASLFIPPLHVFWFYIFYTPSYFHLNLNYETPILNGLLTFRTFPLLLTAKTECKGCVNKKSNVPTNFFTASFITDLPKYWKQWPP